MFKLSKLIGAVMLVGASVSTASAQPVFNINFDDLAPTPGPSPFAFGSFLSPNTNPMDGTINDGCTQTPGTVIGAGNYQGFAFGQSIFNFQTTQRGWGCTTAANPYSGSAPGGATNGYAYSFDGAQSLFIDFGMLMFVHNVRLAGVGLAQSSVEVIGYDMAGTPIFTTGSLGLTSNFEMFSPAFDGVRALEFRGLVGTNDRYFGVDDINVSPVPEPSTYALMGAGLLALVGIKRRRRA